jgi:hypothetical protein
MIITWRAEHKQKVQRTSATSNVAAHELCSWVSLAPHCTEHELGAAEHESASGQHAASTPAKALRNASPSMSQDPPALVQSAGRLALSQV